MSITIENTTAEAVWEAIQQLPPIEVERLLSMLSLTTFTPTSSSEWSRLDQQDLDISTGLLIEERFGPEEGDYD